MGNETSKPAEDKLKQQVERKVFDLRYKDFKVKPKTFLDKLEIDFWTWANINFVVQFIQIWIPLIIDLAAMSL